MGDLGDIFARRRLARAVDAFTDRVEQHEAFREAFDRHRAAVIHGATGFEFAARNNILTFYGMGGIGKSELSRRLEHWIAGTAASPPDWPPTAPVGYPLITTRLDLDSRGAFGVKEAVLALRASAGALGGRLPSFDLALQIWWSLAAAGEAIPDLPEKPTTFTTDVKGHIRDEIQDTAAGALESLGIALTSGASTLRVLRTILQRVRERNDRRIAGTNPHLHAVLEAVAQRPDLVSLAHLPGLLTWDLRSRPPAERPLWVVFVDTYEVLNGTAERTSEQLFQRLVLSLPDVLWVLTGRNQLDWADERLRGSLYRVGASTWPGLVADAALTQQHCVGDMSPTDAARFLDRAVATLPEMGVDIRQGIVDAASGVPLYLDLAIDRACDLLSRREELSVGAVALPFPALLSRIVRDLPEDERLALLGACLFARFDEGLASTAAACSVSAVERLCARALVTRQPWEHLPLKVHDLVRETVRETDAMSGGWAAPDWAAALRRGLEELERRHAIDVDPERRLDLFALGMHLAYETGDEVAWLHGAAVEQPTMRRAANMMPPIPEGRHESWAAGLHAMLSCWIDDGTSRPRWKRLQQLAAERNLGSRLELSARRFMAYNMRSNGEPAAALDVFNELIASGDGSRRLHLYQRGLTLIRLRRYTEAKATADMLENEFPSCTEGPRLVGLLDQWHGRLQEAGDAAMRRARQLSTEGKHRIAVENESAALRCYALLDPTIRAPAESLAERCMAAGQLDIVRSSRCWAALATAGDTQQFSAAHDALLEAFDLLPSMDAGDVTETYRRWLPSAFHAAVLGRPQDLLDATASLSGSPTWHRIAEFWLTSLLPSMELGPPDRDWLEPESVVQARWNSVITRRRQQLRHS